MAVDRAQVGQRIKKARKDIGLSGAEASRQLGVTPSYVSDMERGRSKASSEYLTLLASHGVNVNWLLTGSGQRLNDGEVRSEPTVDVRPEVKLLSQDELVEIAADLTTYLRYVSGQSPLRKVLMAEAKTSSENERIERALDQVRAVFATGEDGKMEWLEQSLAWLTGAPGPGERQPALRPRTYWRDEHSN